MKIIVLQFFFLELHGFIAVTYIVAMQNHSHYLSMQNHSQISLKRISLSRLMFLLFIIFLCI